MRKKTIAGVVVIAFLAAALGFGACQDLHHGKVPADAKPAGFKQLARWDSCGASGEYCSEVIILGRNGISFEYAVRDIEGRYSEQGWTVKTFLEDERDDGGLIISNLDNNKCVSLSRFNILKYRRDLALDAPDAATMAKLVEPYETIIRASAGICG